MLWDVRGILIVIVQVVNTNIDSFLQGNRLIWKRRHKRYFSLGNPQKDWDETFYTLSQNICCVEDKKQVILELWENVKKMTENLESAEENKKKK